MVGFIYHLTVEVTEDPQGIEGLDSTYLDIRMRWLEIQNTLLKKLKGQ